MSFTSFNTPNTTPEGEFAAGVGSSMIIDTDEEDRSVTPLPAFYGRVGLSSQLDAGFKVEPWVMFADLKYQLVDRRLKVAADMGVSYGLPNTVTAYPALFVGTDHFYVGGRVAALSSRIDDDDSSIDEDLTFSGVVPGVMAGASIGDKFRVMPEVNIHFSTEGDRPVVLPAIGVQYRFGDSE